MTTVSDALGGALTHQVVHARARTSRLLKSVGVWSLTSVTRSVLDVFEYARGTRGVRRRSSLSLPWSTQVAACGAGT